MQLFAGFPSLGFTLDVFQTHNQFATLHFHVYSMWSTYTQIPYQIAKKCPNKFTWNDPLEFRQQNFKSIKHSFIYLSHSIKVCVKCDMLTSLLVYYLFFRCFTLVLVVLIWTLSSSRSPRVCACVWLRGLKHVNFSSSNHLKMKKNAHTQYLRNNLK